MSRHDFLVVCVWSAAVLCLLAPTWLMPGYVFFNHGDLFTYHIPLRGLTASNLQSGHLPFWNPYILLGVPHAANPQSALFYPATLLSSILPVWSGVVWDQTLHLLWAGLGVFLLARVHRVDRFGAALLATSFALSPFLIYRIVAGIPTLLAALSWTPWLWLAWTGGSTSLLAAVIALQLLSGHGQFLVVDAVGMGIWAAASRERGRLLGRLLAGWAAALVLTCIQWAPTLEFLRSSVRTDWATSSSTLYAARIELWKLWLAPWAAGNPLAGTWHDATSEFYELCGACVGPFALLAALGGALYSRRKAGALSLLVVGTLLALGPGGPLPRAVFGAPVLSYLRAPARWELLTVWAVILLAGSGITSLESRRLPPVANGVLAVAAFLFLAAWDFSFLRPQNSAVLLAGNQEVREIGDLPAGRVLTDPALANQNKTMLYRLMNVNGYEAFYPKTAAMWAAAAEGPEAVEASRILLSRWPNEALGRAGVTARISASGVDFGPPRPLATYVDVRGRRVQPDPRLFIERAERWRLSGHPPAGAAAVALAQPFYPGWTAVLDGKPVSARPWQIAFQVVPLPIGRPPGVPLDLFLLFRPTGWTLLCVLTAAAWGLWFTLTAAEAGEPR